MGAVNGALERLERLQEYLASDPLNRVLRLDVFDAALAARRLDVAREVVGRALAESPADAVWRHRRTALQLAEQDYEAALAELEALRSGGAEDPAVIHDIAFALFRMGRIEEASSRVQPLLELDGDRGGPAWALWLRCQHHLDRTPDGLEALRARLHRDRVAPDALSVASLMALDLGLLDDADALSAAALKGGELMEALVTRGTLALSVNGAGEAATWFGRALSLGPTDGRTWSGMAIARLMAQDLPGADQAFARAVETLPDHEGTWIAWGWCLLFLDKLHEARGSFEKALSLDRTLGESHGGLAAALARLGEREAAQREIELALRLDPRGLGARYAEAVLQGRTQDRATMQALSHLASRIGRSAQKRTRRSS